uniref:Putative outer membrane protein A n=1 Tax=termite gut metagenome TaxID=433724 RepID=S0DF91_9ZZZZ
MTKIHDSIMSLIKPARIATASATLGETEHKVIAATDLILPALLEKMVKKGDTPEVEAVLKEAEKLKIYENYDKIWEGSGIDTHVNIGERMENRLLGTHDPKFNANIAAKVGMKEEHVDRLTNWIAATMTAWIAAHMAGGKSYKSLLTELAGEHKPVEHKAEPHKTAAHKAATHTTHAAAPKKKCRLGWLWWLLGLLALAAIICLCWRSCCKKEIKTNEQVTVVHEVTKPAFEVIKMHLPDGTPITMYRGHLESAIKAFLDSDKFKNATDAELRSVWFEFNDIEFEHNSATALMPGAQAQLNTLVGILKNYPGVKIKIGAFADKTGTRAVNYAISEQRALNIEAALEKAGVHADHVSTEGFGEDYAKVAESASDLQRAPDRDIAMRFTK